MNRVFINIHSHHPDPRPGHLVVHSIWPGQALLPANYFSIGLHPWHLNPPPDDDWKALAASANCIAIGEAGLDKHQGADWNLQMEAFQSCIDLAETLKKPLIIHCVRSFSEIISLKKRLNPAQAWIIHGFNKNNETGRQLIDAGFYLSFGAALLHPNTTNFISQMPLHRLFFETDALPEVSIEQVYERAANLCNMELPHLQAQVAENFEQIFL